jgi:hypothetical protein
MALTPRRAAEWYRAGLPRAHGKRVETSTCPEFSVKVAAIRPIKVAKPTWGPQPVDPAILRVARIEELSGMQST